MAVNPIPEGFHTVTPYLTIKGATELLEFMKQAFGAEETECMRDGAGRVTHAQVLIGDSNVMMGECPVDHEPMPSMLYLYVDDVDAWFKQAVAAGGEVIEEPGDKFYGDRSGAVQDASGNRWYIATHVEDVPPEEMARRAQAEMLPRE
jgi:PhnB protein